MPRRRLWFDRRFEVGLPPEAFPDIIERLRGTPARLEDRLLGIDQDRLVRRVDTKWSIQEHAGHLLDLEPLWEARFDELLAGASTLRLADLTNRATHDARHNQRQLVDILSAFRSARARVVRRLERASDLQLGMAAMHPRLQQPMTAVDLFFFVAEHDDHHLAAMTEILNGQEL